MAQPWLNQFLSDLSAGRKGQALDRLVAARAQTLGLGEGWEEALVACIRAGWMPGCEALAGWGVQIPRAHLPTRRLTIRQKVMQAVKQTEEARRAGLLEQRFFQLPNGEPTTALSPEALRDLYRILFVSSFPPMTAQEWATAMEVDEEFALDKLEGGEVGAWGGAASARAMAGVLKNILTDEERPLGQVNQVLSVLQCHFPRSLKDHADNLVKGVLTHLHRDVQGKLVQHIPQPQKGPLLLEAAVGVFKKMGVDNVNQRARAYGLEDLFVLAIRHNTPTVFLDLLREGVDPWQSAAHGRLTRMGGEDASGEDMFTMLALRIVAAPQFTRQAWWQAATQVFALEGTSRSLARKAQSLGTLFQEEKERLRWQALTLQMHLERTLEEAAPSPSMPPAAKTRL